MTGRNRACGVKTIVIFLEENGKQNACRSFRVLGALYQPGEQGLLTKDTRMLIYSPSASFLASSNPES
jgi:hypothetical protein